MGEGGGRVLHFYNSVVRSVTRRLTLSYDVTERDRIGAGPANNGCMMSY